MIQAGEELNVLQGRPAGTLRLNAARVSIAMVLQQVFAGFFREHPHVQIELTHHEGFIDIVERGFDAGIRMSESVQQDMVAVPLGGPVTMAVVGSPAYFERFPAPRHPNDLALHNCVRFRGAGSGTVYKWEFEVDGRPVEYEVRGSLTTSDSLFGVEAALEGVGLAYTFEQLAEPHVRAKRLRRVLTEFSPTFPGFYLYFPSRHDQPTKLKALVEYVTRAKTVQSSRRTGHREQRTASDSGGG
ncbi:LysR substrate-binding domain-containing protein [Variovorax sp. J31P207]|uniref:LysR substrate-binding domain-containing protein n=1 Tax=Variovorax sp. J31P207 TaxID=3053510 RepID=UPI0025782285|nr:LysR substrate-binding domain-containing protein [Variovorax sp. J31P207]MDM0071728.1 LysR substrate-binding domain-containing protein [Variovorax sp. J31P207]